MARKPPKSIPYRFFPLPARIVETAAWKTLKLLELRAYLAIAYQLRQGKAPIKVQDIADRAGISRASAKRALVHLRQLGMIRARSAPGLPTVFELAAGAFTEADLAQHTEPPQPGSPMLSHPPA